jgi:N-acetylmuramoyl-L-alanine amidase
MAVKVVRLSWRGLKLLAAFGVAALAVLNLLVGDVPGPADIEQVDLTALSGKVIAVDPGHGGVDGGARHNGLTEKDVTLALALKLGAVLEERGATVVLTRETDMDFYSRGKGGKRSDLERRAEIINNSGADLFISVHANAIAGARWFGAEVYYNPRFAASRKLAEVTQVALHSFPPGNKRKVKQDSEILVLKETNIPGMLIEAGFLSNPREAALLADPSYQRNMAEQIARALAYHFTYNVAR